MVFLCGLYQSRPQGNCWRTEVWLLYDQPSPLRPSGKGVCPMVLRWESSPHIVSYRLCRLGQIYIWFHVMLFVSNDNYKALVVVLKCLVKSLKTLREKAFSAKWNKQACVWWLTKKKKESGTLSLYVKENCLRGYFESWLQGKRSRLWDLFWQKSTLRTNKRKNKKRLLLIFSHEINCWSEAKTQVFDVRFSKSNWKHHQKKIFWK